MAYPHAYQRIVVACRYVADKTSFLNIVKTYEEVEKQTKVCVSRITRTKQKLSNLGTMETCEVDSAKRSSRVLFLKNMLTIV